MFKALENLQVLEKITGIQYGHNLPTKFCLKAYYFSLPNK